MRPNCRLIKIHSYLSLDTYPKPSHLSAKYLDIKTLLGDSETPRKTLAGLYKPSVQGANREAVEQCTAVQQIHLSYFPLPAICSQSLFSSWCLQCNRTREKGLVPNTKQVQKRNRMHQGLEASGSSSFCFSCPSPLTSAQHGVGSI